MEPRKKPPTSRGRTKTPKNQRAHRACPHCGQIQQVPAGKTAPHKPGGLKHRRAKKQDTAEGSVTTGQRNSSSGPDPIDAKTVINGVVERIPAALERTNAAEPPSPTALNTAVRKAVLDEFRTRAQFAGRLAEIDALLWSRTTSGDDTVSGAMTEHLRELRMLRVTEPEENDRFVVTEGEGETFELLRPAYVDELTGKVVLAGHLRRVAAPGTVMGEEA